MTSTPNRRRFLIDSGLTALDSTRSFGANDKLRVGVIGAGGRMRQLTGSGRMVGKSHLVFLSTTRHVLAALRQRPAHPRRCRWRVFRYSWGTVISSA
jgi:hypothetical protein